MNNIRHFQKSGRLPRYYLWKVHLWDHHMSWCRPCWRLTTITCKCCSNQTVFRKDKKQGRTYVFKCQKCKHRWIGKMPAGAELTNAYKYPDGRIIGWDVRSDKPNKPNLAGDEHGWPIAQEENSDANATSQSLSTN